MSARAAAAERREQSRRKPARIRQPTEAPQPFVRLGLILAGVTFLAYLPSLKSGFIWDDDLHLTHNLITRTDGLYRTWFTTQQPNYWPITWSAFWMQWRLFGMDPTGYHVVNVLLHALNAVLAWRVLARLAVPGAWAAALVFALHPVNVETAAWITQLKTLLAMAFYLASLLCYLRYDEDGEPKRYGAAAGLFALGLLAKPSIVMLPVALLLCAWWKRGRIGKTDLVRTAPFFALSAVISLLEIWFQYNRSMAGVVIRTDGLVSRLAGAAWVIWFYLGKAFVPVNLNFVYPRWTIDPAAAATWIPGAALVATAAAAWWKRSAWGRHVLFALGYFASTLFPVLGFLNIFYMRYSFVADHWQYVAILAPVALLTGAAAWRVQKLPEQARKAAFAAGICVAALLFAMTWMRQGAFLDLETNYRVTLEGNPAAVLARANLASLLYKKATLIDDPDLRKAALLEVIGHYEKALAIDAADPESCAGLGNALKDLGRYSEAAERYKAALPMMPELERFKVHFELGETYARLGRTKEAVAEFEEVLRLRPGLPPAQQRLQQLKGAL